MPKVASFQIDDGNNFVEYNEEVPKDTDLRLRAIGKGYFLVQVRLYQSDLYLKCPTKILYKCVFLTNL